MLPGISRRLRRDGTGLFDGDGRMRHAEGTGSSDGQQARQSGPTKEHGNTGTRERMTRWNAQEMATATAMVAETARWQQQRQGSEATGWFADERWTAVDAVGWVAGRCDATRCGAVRCGGQGKPGSATYRVSAVKCSEVRYGAVRCGAVRAGLSVRVATSR